MLFFFSSRRRHTRSLCDWSSDVCSSDLGIGPEVPGRGDVSTGGGGGGIAAPGVETGMASGGPEPFGGVAGATVPDKIGRASCRERAYLMEVGASVNNEDEKLEGDKRAAQ